MIAPHGRAGVNATFGNAGDENSQWYKENIIRIAFPFPLLYEQDGGKTSPVKTCLFHKKAASSLIAALTDIWIHARGEVKKQVGYEKTTEEYDALTYDWLKNAGLLNYGGTYVYRAIRGAKSLSMHAYGIAIDMAPGANGLGKNATSLPAWYIECFRDHGFFWGGDFSGRKDPMHFQLAVGV